MEWTSGSDLDRHIARLLQGNDVQPAAYSTSPVASRRLLSLLSKSLGIEAVVDRDGDLLYCRLTRSGGTVATGAAATRELAVARAAANLSVAVVGTVPPGAPAERRPRAPRHRRALRPASVPCDVCGAPMKPPPSASNRRHCNPCAYRLLMAAARDRNAAAAPQESPKDSAG